MADQSAGKPTPDYWSQIMQMEALVPHKGPPPTPKLPPSNQQEKNEKSTQPQTPP